MNEIPVSLLIPTRGRPSGLVHTLNSFLNLADDAMSFEVLLGCDEDDLPSNVGIIAAIKMVPRIRIWCTPQLGYDRLHEYYNTLASMSSGRWLWIMNDDFECRTRSWDSLIAQQEDVCLLNPLENATPDGPSFCQREAIVPIFPRRWLEVLGHLSAWNHNDTYATRVAKEVGIFRQFHQLVVGHLRTTGFERYHKVEFPHEQFRKDIEALKAALLNT